MKTLIALGTAALMLSPAAAPAQEAGNAAQASRPSAQGTDIPPASDSAATASFTQEQIELYVTAALAVREMEADTALDAAARQQRASAILAEAGLDAATFNAISQAVRTDPEVAERVQLAMTNRRGSPDAGA